MADTSHDQHGHGGHDEIHLPPNSWVPLSTAASLTTFFIGIIVGVWLAIIGLVCLILSLLAWVRAARNEFQELPD
ncbi:MAG TPA: cytochrome c oxidase subunit 4 [Candidatus Dormibacteraeota bacterium]|jgi:hypothetical protein